MNVEIRDILLSLLILSFAFAYPEVLSEPSILLVIIFAVGLGFLLHELAHKFIAKKFGCAAEYKAYYKGLGLAVLFAIITNGSFIFAAPGAVYFSGLNLSKKKIGLVSLSGPATNIILFSIFFTLSKIVFPGMGFLTMLFGMAAVINIWLALFNLIPIPLLDGQKIFSWNKIIWGSVFIASIIGFLTYILI